MTLEEEIELKVPQPLRQKLKLRDAAAHLITELPRAITPEKASEEGGTLQRIWELCGLYFANIGRFYDAQAIFYSLYDHMLAYQEMTNSRVHKGMPLVWISDYHALLGHPTLAKRYLMLTT